MTIEGLSHGDTMHQVQAAFVKHDAMQCGFCTPGMVMSCAALLDRHPNPKLDDVKIDGDADYAARVLDAVNII